MHRAPKSSLFVVFVGFAGVLGLLSCDGEPLAELDPDIAVDPVALDFGTRQPNLPHADIVDVGNRGTGALTIRKVTVVPDDVGFTVNAVPNRVGVGQKEPISLTLVLGGPGPVTAELHIESDDADMPDLVVPLTAEGGVGRLLITPDPLTFGVVNEGPGAARALNVHNDGLDFVTVRSATFVGGDGPGGDNGVGFVVDAAALPISLSPQESVNLLVSLQPTAALLVGRTSPDLVDELLLDTSLGPRPVAVTATINLAPIARVVERDSRRNPVKIGVNDPVVADGSETVDPEGDAFAFLWSVPVRPAGSIAVVIGQGQPEVRVTPDVVGVYAIRLRATDVHGAFREDDLDLLPRDLAAVLTWTASGAAACNAFSAAQCDAFTPQERQLRCCGQSDLDIHLVGPRDQTPGVLGDYGACPGTCEDEAFCAEESDAHVDTCRQTGLDASFANRSPEWGLPGRADDPRLDIDDVAGNGPEVISLNEPADGLYRLVVHYCLDRIDEPSLATVTLFDEGQVLAVAGPQAVNEGQAWIAAVLERRGGAWQPPVVVPGIFDSAVPADLCSR